MRNKEFIYRTRDKNDHITHFCDRIQVAFPTAQLLMSPKPVTDEMKQVRFIAYIFRQIILYLQPFDSLILFLRQ